MAVIVYSTSLCPWCAKTKEFLKENKISFKNVDVGTNRKGAKEMIRKSGQQAVPVIDANGAIIIGFGMLVSNKKAVELGVSRCERYPKSWTQKFLCIINNNVPIN